MPVNIRICLGLIALIFAAEGWGFWERQGKGELAPVVTPVVYQTTNIIGVQYVQNVIEDAGKPDLLEMSRVNFRRITSQTRNDEGPILPKLHWAADDAARAANYRAFLYQGAEARGHAYNAAYGKEIEAHTGIHLTVGFSPGRVLEVDLFTVRLPEQGHDLVLVPLVHARLLPGLEHTFNCGFTSHPGQYFRYAILTDGYHQEALRLLQGGIYRRLITCDCDDD